MGSVMCFRPRIHEHHRALPFSADRAGHLPGLLHGSHDTGGPCRGSSQHRKHSSVDRHKQLIPSAFGHLLFSLTPLCVEKQGIRRQNNRSSESRSSPLMVRVVQTLQAEWQSGFCRSQDRITITLARTSRCMDRLVGTVSQQSSMMPLQKRF